MVTLIRVEAEAETLGQVTKELDAVEAAIRKTDKTDLSIHDEHYERIHGKLVKGRKVFRQGEGFGVKTNPTTFVGGGSSGVTSPGFTYKITNAA